MPLSFRSPIALWQGQTFEGGDCSWDLEESGRNISLSKVQLRNEMLPCGRILYVTIRLFWWNKKYESLYERKPCKSRKKGDDEGKRPYWCARNDGNHLDNAFSSVGTISANEPKKECRKMCHDLINRVKMQEWGCRWNYPSSTNGETS